ncbi:hypothetical protein KY290_035811 [Solanum tuberosum]|uniref:Uncharacterized protein n=1 Tax=Solanum tuberosum TaxID=4113 RepID=A0ABQ7TRI2_SOLTU|nr:hypothetical protein KY290_035811 [Solanum tuberosum]
MPFVNQHYWWDESPFPPPSPPQSPHPSSPAPSPPCVRKEATPIADTEILEVYGSSVPIHSINAPPRKRGSMLNAGEGTYVIRAKGPILKLLDQQQQQRTHQH